MNDLKRVAIFSKLLFVGLWACGEAEPPPAETESTESAQTATSAEVTPSLAQEGPPATERDSNQVPPVGEQEQEAQEDLEAPPEPPSALEPAPEPSTAQNQAASPALRLGRAIRLRQTEERHPSIQDIPEGCEVALSLERFVSLRCGEDEERHLLATDEGAQPLPIEELFLEGATRERVFELLRYRPLYESERAAEDHGHTIVFTPFGLEGKNHWNAAARVLRVPWALFSTALRPETPLGEALISAGATLAEPGQSMPARGAETIAVWGNRPAGVETLINGWAQLSPEVQPTLRLVTPGGHHEGALVLPPNTPEPLRERIVGQIRRTAGGLVNLAPAVFPDAGGELRMMQLREDVEVRSRPQRSGEASSNLPAGTIVPALRGYFNRAVSDPSGSFAYIGYSPSARGWVQGTQLAPASSICPPTSIDRAHILLRGEVAHDSSRIAEWAVYRDIGSLGNQFRIAAVSDCEPSASRVFRIRERPTHIFLSRGADAGSLRWVLIDRRRNLRVYSLASSEPLVEERLERNERFELTPESESIGRLVGGANERSIAESSALSP